MRTPSESGPSSLSRLLDAAAERGVIDAAQRAALHELAGELAHTTPPASVEAPRGLNAITVAYSAGALLVLFALGWFLADRWRDLGTGGVLVVSALYAVAFAATSAQLRRRGFRVAGGLAATLAVSMTPVWTFALLRLTGEWPAPVAWNDPLIMYPPWLESRRIVLELATIGVALATVRRVRFSALGAPMAVAFVALLLSIGNALADPRLTWYVGPYYQAFAACLVLALAYLIDRRQPSGEDYAIWFYAGGLVMLFAAYVQLWDSMGRWRHALPLTAAALVIASLYLRRRVLLVGGGVAAFGYLGYLAFDVFRRVFALPVALAGLGLLVIVVTVWMQRRFPTLVARVSRTDDHGAKQLPAGWIYVLGPVVIAATALLFAMSEANERTIDREFRDALYRRRAARDARLRPPSAVVEPRRSPR